jgi:hypothetical protein
VREAGAALQVRDVSAPARRDVTEAGIYYGRRRCPDCDGHFWWPYTRCGGTVPLERELGTNDGVVEYVRECPREGRGPA